MKRAALFLALAACGSPSEPPPHVVAAGPTSTAATVLPAITTTSLRTSTTQRANRSARVTPTPSRPNPRRAGSCGGWEGLIGQYPWPVDQACRVMMCESGGNPNADNPTSSAAGLFQILGGSYDPAENVAHAYRMWAKRGWSPWVCKP